MDLAVNRGQADFDQMVLNVKCVKLFSHDYFLKKKLYLPSTLWGMYRPPPLGNTPHSDRDTGDGIDLYDRLCHSCGRDMHGLNGCWQLMVIHMDEADGSYNK